MYIYKEGVSPLVELIPTFKGLRAISSQESFSTPLPSKLTQPICLANQLGFTGTERLPKRERGRFGHPFQYFSPRHADSFSSV
jgi:hypothetical protein